MYYIILAHSNSSFLQPTTEPEQGQKPISPAVSIFEQKSMHPITFQI